VLIAESEFDARDRIARELIQEGIAVDAAPAAADAVAYLRQTRYDVLVLDLALSRGEIDEVLQDVGSLPESSRPVVLVLASNAEAARSLDVEVVQIVLRKPIKLRQLVDVVASCIRSYGGSRPDAGQGTAQARS
jgi:DNA-binding response OmpR family regulator